MKELLINNKPYRLLLFSTITARFGNSITAVLLMYIIATTTNQPLYVSFVLFAQLVPMVIIGLFSGTIADRFPRHSIMIFSEWFQILTVVAIIFALNHPVLLICLIFLQGVGASFYQPARSAFVSEIVDRELLAKAIGYSQSIYQAMAIIGPSIAGLLLLFLQPTQILLINIFTFLASTAFIYFAAKHANIKKRTKPVTPSGESIIQSIKIGVNETFQIAPLRFLLLLIVMVMFCAGIFNANSEVILLQEFKISSYHYGLISAAMGVGGIIGSLTGPSIIKRVKPSLFFIFATGSLGLWMIVILPIYLYGEAFSLLFLYSWVLIIGLFNAFLNIPVSSLFLTVTPNAIRGRAVSILQMLSNLGVIIGILLGGLLSTYFGAISITAIAGIVTIITAFSSTLMKGFKTLLGVKKPKALSN